MKTHLTALALFFSVGLYAQKIETTIAIKASDPTQVYAFLETYGGLNFLGNNMISTSLDTWEAGFRGQWAVKSFRLGVFLPVSNNTSNFRVFDDITLDAGYQIHNNSGLYNATVIGVGFVSPAKITLDPHSFESVMSKIYPNVSNFNKYYFNYLGSIKFSEKFAFYPGFEWFRGMNNVQASYQNTDTTSVMEPIVYANGFKFSGTVSYDINAKNFVQFFGSYATEKWDAKYGSSNEIDEKYSNIIENRLAMYLKYQYAITTFAQAYFKTTFHTCATNQEKPYRNYQNPNLFGYQIGFTYFLH